MLQICQDHTEQIRSSLVELGVPVESSVDSGEVSERFRARMMAHIDTFDAMVFCVNMLWNMAFDQWGLPILESKVCPVCRSEDYGHTQWIASVTQACASYYEARILPRDNRE